MNNDKVVWLIEDDENDAEEYKRFLEQSGELTVVFEPARPSITDYNDLLTDPRTGAIIIDQLLSDFANAPYEGLDLADYLRTLSPELPIYILTNYAGNEELEARGQTVESIIKKESLRNHIEVTVARLLRSIKRYEAALTEKQQRLKLLIDRKLSGDLTEAEEKELQSLRSDIERPFDIELAEQEQKREDFLYEQEERLAKLEEIAHQILKELPQKRQSDSE